MTFYDEVPTAQISVEGHEANDFLQGLLTKDITLAQEHVPVYAFMLTPQGRFLYDMFVFKTAEGYR